MAQETVTRQEMRDLNVGQTRIFVLKDRKKIASVRVQANQLNKEEGLKFRVVADFEASSVCITRQA